ncbi:MAG: DUF732 domain-containing protein [Chloroflexi bacterium]|nr:DUF732 domain-containing protein [Chloroflexota bacterium]
MTHFLRLLGAFTMFLAVVVLTGCSSEPSAEWEDEEYCESLGRAGKFEYAIKGHCLTAESAEQARLEREWLRENCRRPEYRNTTLCAPTATPSRSDEVFRLWYGAGGYPAEAFNAVLALVNDACSALRGGASGREVASTIGVASDPSLVGDILYIVGGGVEALCPDQSHKFQ